MKNITIEKINDYSNLSDEEIIDIANKKTDIDTEKFIKYKIISWKLFNLNGTISNIDDMNTFAFISFSISLSSALGSFILYFFPFDNDLFTFYVCLLNHFIFTILFLISYSLIIIKEYFFKKEHIENDSFKLLTIEEIVNITKLHYDKRNKILKLLKSNYLVDKKEMDKIIDKKNRNEYSFSSEIHSYYEKSNKFKKEFSKKIKEYQSEAIKIILNPNFTNKMDFKVEYKIDNGPLKVKYVNSAIIDINDYINQMCLETYRRTPSFINIKELK